MGRLNSIINYYCLRLGVLLRPAVVFAAPFELQIEPTNRCNVACSMCLRNIYHRDPEDMKFEYFAKIIEQFPYLKFVTLHGWGEPLLNQDLFKMIDYAYQKGIATAFATNGVLINAAMGRNIIESHLDMLVFSVDSVQPQIFESTRKGSFFEDTERNIRCLVDLKKELRSKSPKLVISSTILKENVNHLETVIRFAKDLDIGEVSFHLAYYPDQDAYQVLGVDKIKIKEIFGKLFYLGSSLNIKVIYSALPYRHGLCPTSWFIPFVAVNGDVFVCCYQKDPVGNLLREGFSNIWNSQTYQSFRKQIKISPNNICRCCPYLLS